MASDVAQFTRDAFLASLREVKLPSQLDEEFQNAKLLMEYDNRKRRIWSSTESAAFLNKLYDLNDALAECRLFFEQQQQLVKSEKNKCLFRFALNPSQRFVRKMKKRLESMNKDLSNFNGNLDRSPATVIISLTGKHTSPEAHTSQFTGFRRTEEKVAALLSDGKYKAIGVYGIGGTGKTALIQKILSSPDVGTKFDPIIWVCLSDTGIDGDEEADIPRHNITKEILFKMGCDVDEEFAILNPTTSQLLQHLKESLTYKKYLLVLDDVWQASDFLSNLGDTHTSPDRLSYALPKDRGGVVIITSRLKQVAEKMVGGNNNHMIHMTPLDRDNVKLFLLEKTELGFEPYELRIVNWLINMRGYKAIGILGPSCPTITRLTDKVLESSSVRNDFQPIIRLRESEHDTPDMTLRCLLARLNYEVDEAMLKDHANLFKTLTNLLTDKNFLIVLDDMTHLDYWFSDLLSSIDQDYPSRLSQALPHGNGAVIVTTTGRSECVARYFVGHSPFLLYVDFADLIKEEHILPNEIVDLCGGLPLAATLISDIIQKKGIKFRLTEDTTQAADTLPSRTTIDPIF